MATSQTVAIIGAGPCGLTAIKNFSDLGFKVTGFDRRSGVGGNWRLNDPYGDSSIFEGTFLVSSKHTAKFDDYPITYRKGDYLNNQFMQEYFEQYTNKFDIEKLIKFNCEILSCDQIKSGGWQVEWHDMITRERHRKTFNALVVASGHHHVPRPLKVCEKFAGTYLHARSFKRTDPFCNKNVLVVGGGNSGADIAVALARARVKTSLSWRRGYHILPKYIFGLPLDLLYFNVQWLPRKFVQLSLQLMLYLWNGRNDAIGLLNPDHRPLESHPLVNDYIRGLVSRGLITPYPNISRVNEYTVHFSDGRSAEFDTIIACTGYQVEHPFLPKGIIETTQSRPRLYLQMIPEAPRNLYFIGLLQSIGCVWAAAELQAKLAARHLAGLWIPEDDLSVLIDTQIREPMVGQIDTLRHAITIDGPQFRRQVTHQLERCRPASDNGTDGIYAT